MRMYIAAVGASMRQVIITVARPARDWENPSTKTYEFKENKLCHVIKNFIMVG